MQEEGEQDRTSTEKEKAAFDDVKGDSSTCHVRVTKPSTDLNRYIVDKFHPPKTKAKQFPLESIDLSIYKPSARCLGKRSALQKIDYYFGLLHSHKDTMSSKVTWKEQDGHSSPSKCDKLDIHLVVNEIIHNYKDIHHQSCNKTIQTKIIYKNKITHLKQFEKASAGANPL